MSTENPDRTQIGLTSENQQRLEDLLEKGWFVDGQDVGRLCLAYAIRAEVPEGDTPRVKTQWGMGNFDTTGEIREVVQAIFPDCPTPVRLIQHLVNEGIEMVHAIAQRPGVGPSELLTER